MISIRNLRAEELGEADRIFRLAFGTFLKLPDPLTFGGDADFIRGRWKADPSRVIAAEVDGALAGTNIATVWGSFGYFGPLTVRPDLWDRGVAKALLEATLPLFKGCRHLGLYTFPSSPKHHGLYQKFGFWPRYLTSLMEKPVSDSRAPWVPAADVRRVCHSNFDGLDVSIELKSGQGIMLPDGSGFAVCHVGAGSEGGSNTCYVKFGAVDRGDEPAFRRLLSACESFAASKGVARLVAGVNTARHGAYKVMLESGFRTFMSGVAMQNPNEPGYNVPDVYVIDDWR